MYSKDAAIRVGQSVQIEVSNKPYVDMTIPPEANDYRWSDYATIEIYEPLNGCKVVCSPMSAITNRPGWYSYRFQTTEQSAKGVYRVIVRLGTFINPPSPSGSPAPSGCPGTSGNPPCDDILSDVKVSYFTVMDLF